jgi:hypothetical protein
MLRTAAKGFIVFAAFVNAVPSLAELRPEPGPPALIEDDLMGSGRELQPVEARDSPARRPLARRNSTDRAVGAIRIARAELLRREPALGEALAARLPHLRRDDLIGTIARADNAIRYNAQYVTSLSASQLLEHLWQLAASLESPL